MGRFEIREPPLSATPGTLGKRTGYRVRAAELASAAGGTAQLPLFSSTSCQIASLVSNRWVKSVT